MSKFPKRDRTETNCVTTKSKTLEQLKDVKINDVPISAILDTGSYLMIMRADQYVKMTL